MNTEPDKPEFEPANDEHILFASSDANEQSTDTAKQSACDETETLQRKLVEAEKQVMLAQADLENFRKRTRRENQEQIRYASLPLMNDLLEAVDNLHRAIDAASGEDASPTTSNLLQGVSMVAQQISSILENHGCKKIESLGVPFDPNLHQAVQMQPSEEFPPNVVMQELRSGFQLHDRVIRPSQVFVSTGKPQPAN